ncbi:MAG: SDR family oxidoreductase [Chloroflexi bacterium]|nr:SDR family oxidoreductase [Chloroflexota bacterium]
MGQLDGKVSIITGGGSGIGKGIATALAGEGSSIVIAARDAERLTATANEITASTGSDVLTVQTDVTDEAAVKRLFQSTMERFGRLDILVNNSGRFDGGRIDELTLETFAGVLSVNVIGPFLCTREAFKIMKDAGGGRIINIGSIASNRARQFSAPYTTSKHALWGLTQCTALDGREFGISCGQLNPGNVAVERRVASGGSPASGLDMGPEPQVETADMARAALYMATLPPSVNTLEMSVLPVGQLYIGRG